MIIRKSAFDKVGLFEPRFQRKGGNIGSLEDHEFQERLWDSGGRCWYTPDAMVWAAVQAERLDRSYHRRWHYGHGRMYAMLRHPDVDVEGPRILGVPRYIFKQVVRDAVATVIEGLRGRQVSAFTCEARMHFHLGFIAERIAHRS